MFGRVQVMTRVWRWLGGLILGTMILGVGFMPAVWANLGPPSYGGQVTAEPLGIEDIEITHETLTIDLRPIAQKDLAQVEAVYRLYNEGDAKQLDLLFALGTLGTEDFQVWLNDRAIASQPAPTTPIPPSWDAPEYTPGLDNQPLDYLQYSTQVTPMALTVTIPPRKQDLRVRYTAQTATHLTGEPTIYHQFAYILAPAKAWSAFGGLEVTIYLPPKWNVATTPDFTRKGDILTGMFTELPSDAIALTMQAPAGWAYLPVKYGTQVLLGLTWLGGLGLGWRLGQTKGQRGTQKSSRLQAWPWSLGFGLIWGMTLLAMGWLAIYSPDWMLPAGQVSRYGYGQGFALIGVIGLSLFSVVLGMIVVFVTANRSQPLKEAN